MKIKNLIRIMKIRNPIRIVKRKSVEKSRKWVISTLIGEALKHTTRQISLVTMQQAKKLLIK
jgi:hypothetical protein